MEVMAFGLLLCFLVGTFASSPEENINVPERAANGVILEEGDIAVQEGNSRGSVNSRMWDNGVLVYEIDSSLDNPTAMGQIKLAMDDWSRTTCIRFKKRTTETAYVSFFQGSGCWSYVGKTGRKQQLSLARGCWGKGTIIHEIGHALGFLHEQSRPDRNNYVEIKFENIQAGKEGNFRISSSIDSLGTPYDYGSVMHYGARYFSKNGKPTIVPKKSGVSIGNRAGLSAIDIKQMNLLYKCKDVDGLTTPKPTTTEPTPGQSYKLIGCFKDKKGKKNAAIPYTGKRFKGPDAIQKCAEIAASKGYSVFAVKRTRCHTGPRAHLTYDKYGKAPDKECKKGRGGRLRNSVYSFADIATPSPPPATPPPPPVTGAPQGDCGVSSVSRVIGGVDAKPGSWPWQIALLRGGRFICGGSLIKPDWVVTAAHCVAGSSNPALYQVRVGDHDRNANEGTEQTLAVSKVISHSQYNKPVPINNDIALLQLKTPASLNSKVRTVCLPSPDFDVPTSSRCFITGWGKIKHPGSSHPILQQAQMPPVAKATCAKKLASSPGGSHLTITDQMLCAGVSGTILSGCHGDSGGPYVCQNTAGRWVLQGAVSWGSPRCAASERYTVFARVAKFRNWIDQHTGGSVTPPPPPSPPPPITQAPPKPDLPDLESLIITVKMAAASPVTIPQFFAIGDSNPVYPLNIAGGIYLPVHSELLVLRMGAHKRRSNVGTEQDFKVTKVITHELYHKPKRYAHDIALLKLERPALLNRYVGLACMPDSVSAPTDGDKCWITGWGTLSSGGSSPNILQQALVPVVSRARCDKAYPRRIHDSMVCAGLDQGGIDACQGDSGGPMVCESGGKFYLQGATSWGYGCAAPGKFGVYADVKYLMSWINQKMAEN